MSFPQVQSSEAIPTPREAYASRLSEINACLNEVERVLTEIWTKLEGAGPQGADTNKVNASTCHSAQIMEAMSRSRRILDAALQISNAIA